MGDSSDSARSVTQFADARSWNSNSAPGSLQTAREQVSLAYLDIMLWFCGIVPVRMRCVATRLAAGLIFLVGITSACWNTGTPLHLWAFDKTNLVLLITGLTNVTFGCGSLAFYYLANVNISSIQYYRMPAPFVQVCTTFAALGWSLHLVYWITVALSFQSFKQRYGVIGFSMLFAEEWWVLAIRACGASVVVRLTESLWEKLQEFVAKVQANKFPDDEARLEAYNDFCATVKEVSQRCGDVLLIGIVMDLVNVLWATWIALERTAAGSSRVSAVADFALAGSLISFNAVHLYPWATWNGWVSQPASLFHMPNSQALMTSVLIFSCPCELKIGRVWAPTRRGLATITFSAIFSPVAGQGIKRLLAWTESYAHGGTI